MKVYYNRGGRGNGAVTLRRMTRLTAWTVLIGLYVAFVAYATWSYGQRPKVDSFATRCFKQGGYVSHYASDQVWCRKRPDDVLDVRQ